MEHSAKFIRSQIAVFKPIVGALSLETIRKGQDALGEIMKLGYSKSTVVKKHFFDNFDASWVLPADETSRAVILYLHGGGYTCGGLLYAESFSTVLAAECGVRVFCAAYRLAPENKFPAAVDDALTAYNYLISQGYTGDRIILCGESAGGGLIYSLCLKLRETGAQMPCGIIAISPWTDLTMSGGTMTSNADSDPSMTSDRLEFFASCYTDTRTNPLVSPLFADLGGMPPSLIFAGGDEILLDDARRMHEKLLEAGCESRLVVRPEMWHGYVLYCLKETAEDMVIISDFITRMSPGLKKLRWMKLDNSAKIYPAAMRKSWSNLFRLSATLTEPVDTEILRSALDITARRFPSIAARVRRGLFWYYLEEIPHAPDIMQEQSYPLSHMPFDDIHRCAFRVIVYKNRIAVEFFHALTDGTGGLIFLKTLVAEYLQQKYDIVIPSEKGVLDRLEEPGEEELEDSFLKNTCDVSLSRRDNNAYRISGIPEYGGFLNLITFTLDSDKVNAAAKAHGVTLTAFVCAALIQAICAIQRERVENPRRRLPVKVLIPVNLRKLYHSRTLRNFVSYITPGIDPKLGDFTFDEICMSIHHQMGVEITPKQMSARITTNVNSERTLFLRVVPLFIKNFTMKAVYDMIGETKSCITFSNLGVADVPDAMKPYVSRMDFILGVPASIPYNCGAISYDNKLRISFIRNIRDPILERHLLEVFKEHSLEVTVESNRR